MEYVDGVCVFPGFTPLFSPNTGDFFDGQHYVMKGRRPRGDRCAGVSATGSAKISYVRGVPLRVDRVMSIKTTASRLRALTDRDVDEIHITWRSPAPASVAPVDDAFGSSLLKPSVCCRGTRHASGAAPFADHGGASASTCRRPNSWS
jgi:hypothetical protein